MATTQAQQAKFDIFIFGSTSEIAQELFSKNLAYFRKNMGKLIVCQRGTTVPAVYTEFNPVAVTLDCADNKQFKSDLAAVVAQHATHDRVMHVLPTYGKFTWNFDKTAPVFQFHDDAYQINLVCRLQILDAFAPYVKNTVFHYLGSLFANFAYTGDYALSMWYVNQLPSNPQYKNYNLRVYNIGGCKTRFWDHKKMGESNPFMHEEMPIKELFTAMFESQEKGVFTFYPSFGARFACFLGSMGVKVL